MSPSENTPSPRGEDDNAPKVSTSRRVVVNTISNWAALGVQALAGMFVLAYVLCYLDEEEFGIYQVALSLTQAIQFLAFGMATANLRVTAEDVARGAWERVSATLSVVRTLMTAAAVVGLGGVVVVSLTCLGLFNIPAGKEPAAALLLQVMAIGSAVHLVRIPYRTALLACNRYELANGVIVGATLLRVGLLVVCFESGWVHLQVLGVAAAGPSVISLVALSWMQRRVLPQSYLSYRLFSWKALRSVMGFSVWSTIGQASFVAQNAAGIPMMSATLGLPAVTAFAIPQQASKYLQRVVGGFTLALWPVAARLGTKESPASLGRLYVSGTRFSTALVVPALVISITHGRPLIEAVKPELAWTHPLFALCIGLAVLQAFGLPATHILWGAGKVGLMIISNVLGVGIGILGALATTVWTDWGLYGFAVAFLLPLGLRGIIVMPLLVYDQLGVPYTMTLIRGGAVPLATGAGAVILGIGLSAAWPPASLWITVVQVAIVALANYGLLWICVLSSDERRLIRRGLWLRLGG